MGKPFEFLKTTNDWLEGVPANTRNAFDNLIGTGENITQHRVDVACAWLAWKVNIAVERKRQALLRVLYGMYQNTVGGKVMAMAMAIKSFVSNPIKQIGKLASGVFGPVPAVIEWAKMLYEELPRLAKNLANLASALPPEPPSPRINYDKFKIKVGTISLATITSDPYSLPAPEVMFPEPEKPFTKEAFRVAFEEDSAQLKSAAKKFKLSKEDRENLEALEGDIG